jgi:hypothetical protein
MKRGDAYILGDEMNAIDLLMSSPHVAAAT